MPGDLEMPETTRALIFVKQRRDNHGAALVAFVALRELGMLDAYLGRSAGDQSDDKSNNKSATLKCRKNQNT